MKFLFAGCELDTESRSLSVDGQIVHVERQVFDLLALLAANADRIVSRDTLLATIWCGRIVSDSAIASRINAARRAVGDDGRRQAIIATAPGIGFRMVSPVSTQGGSTGHPAVAVMPLDCLAGAHGEALLARGIAEQLAGALGQSGQVEVIDTAASFAPALQSIDSEGAAARLGVRYLVVGSLQVSGDLLRVHVRLVASGGGRQVWSGTFDGTRGGIFDLQDRLAVAVLTEIAPHLRRHEFQRSKLRHGTVTAFEHFLRAEDLLREMSPASLLAARSELDRALVQYADYAVAYAMKAWIATLMIPGGVAVDIGAELDIARRAIALGSLDCNALSMAGYALGFLARQPEAGLEHLHRALALNPSAARAQDQTGWLLLYAGRSDEALVHFDRAIALCPLDEFRFRMLTGRAFARLFLGDLPAALVDARRARSAAPRYSVCLRVLAAALAQSGRLAEAQAVAAELRDLSPGFTLSRYEVETRFGASADRHLLFSGLKNAGLT